MKKLNINYGVKVTISLSKPNWLTILDALDLAQAANQGDPDPFSIKQSKKFERVQRKLYKLLEWV